MITKLKSKIGQRMYLAVGEIGSVSNFKVRATCNPRSGDHCLGCCLYGIIGCESMFGSCMAELRPDNTSIIYKKIDEDE